MIALSPHFIEYVETGLFHGSRELNLQGQTAGQELVNKLNDPCADNENFSPVLMKELKRIMPNNTMYLEFVQVLQYYSDFTPTRMSPELRRYMRNVIAPRYYLEFERVMQQVCGTPSPIAYLTFALVTDPLDNSFLDWTFVGDVAPNTCTAIPGFTNLFGLSGDECIDGFEAVTAYFTTFSEGYGITGYTTDKDQTQTYAYDFYFPGTFPPPDFEIIDADSNPYTPTWVVYQNECITTTFTVDDISDPIYINASLYGYDDLAVVRFGSFNTTPLTDAGWETYAETIFPERSDLPVSVSISFLGNEVTITINNTYRSLRGIEWTNPNTAETGQSFFTPVTCPPSGCPIPCRTIDDILDLPNISLCAYGIVEYTQGTPNDFDATYYKWTGSDWIALYKIDSVTDNGTDFTGAQGWVNTDYLVSFDGGITTYTNDELVAGVVFSSPIATPMTLTLVNATTSCELTGQEFTIIPPTYDIYIATLSALNVILTAPSAPVTVGIGFGDGYNLALVTQSYADFGGATFYSSGYNIWIAIPTGDTPPADWVWADFFDPGTTFPVSWSLYGTVPTSTVCYTNSFDVPDATVWYPQFIDSNYTLIEINSVITWSDTVAMTALLDSVIPSMFGSQATYSLNVLGDTVTLTINTVLQPIPNIITVYSADGIGTQDDDLTQTTCP